MGRYVNLTVEAKVDLRDIDDGDLREELEGRDKKKRKEDMYELGDLPIKNLDFRMKMELFIDIWEKYSFTDLKDRLK